MARSTDPVERLFQPRDGAVLIRKLIEAEKADAKRRKAAAFIAFQRRARGSSSGPV